VENPPQSESKQKTSAEAVADSGSAKASGAEKVSGEAGTAPTEAKPAKFTPTPPKTKPAPQAPVVSEDDALVANAEKYLYGRGVPQNCDRALSSLRAAAQRQNSRARSLLGSMYATGHCVPRDLPSAYRWFALASRDNTDNLWVQRNLEMIWREMTPQERQLATQRNQ
jgi:TPR repeat protein